MKHRTFAYWQAATGMQCPLVINEGEPSECRLVARGQHVHIYHYSQDYFCPLTASRRRTASGTNTNPTPTMKTPMKAAVKGAAKGAAKGAMKGAAAAKAAKPAMAAKGSAKK